MSRKLKKGKRKKKKKRNLVEDLIASEKEPAKRPSLSKMIPNYLAVLDFEATCQDRLIMPHWLHEIIEFPVVFLNLETGEVDFIFHSYVRPEEIPVLTEFCTNLTGITQDQVDDAPILEEVISQFVAFLDEHNLKPMYDYPTDCFSFVLATDGPWDCESFLLPECDRKNLPYPHFASHYVNIRHWYANCRDLGNGKMHNVNGMLRKCGLKFEGRPHSGLDDAKNIARIARMCFKFKPRISMKRVQRNRFQNAV